MMTNYSIGDAAKITGVSEKQLRNWEKCQYLQGIQRSISGERAYRRYGEAEINQIQIIKTYLDEGYTLAVSAAKALQNLRKDDEE